VAFCPYQAATRKTPNSTTLIHPDTPYTHHTICVNHGDGKMHPPKFTVGDGYITIPQYGWLIVSDE